MVGRHLGAVTILRGIDNAHELQGRRDEIFINIITHCEQPPPDVHRMLQEHGWIVWNIDDSASRRKYYEEHPQR